MTFQYLHACRLCHKDVRHYEAVRYGKRHYAHFACYLDSGKRLEKLHTWQLESFPWRLIHDRKLDAAFEALLIARWEKGEGNDARRKNDAA